MFPGLINRCRMNQEVTYTLEMYNGTTNGRVVNNLQSMKTTHLDPYEQTHTYTHTHTGILTEYAWSGWPISASWSVCVCVCVRRRGAPLSSCHVTACSIVGALRSAADLYSNYLDVLWGFHGDSPQAQTWRNCRDEIISSRSCHRHSEQISSSMLQI